MILDRIEHLNRYSLPHREKILGFLNSRDARSVADGEHEIDGRDLFVRVMTLELKPSTENRFETHQMYADLQYIAQGVELMQVAPVDQLKPATQYDAKGDYQFFTAEQFITDLVVRTGEFAIFYPGEAHRPGCLHPASQGPVKKLVFKIRL
jgi:biofilm protein TabA